MQNEIRAEALRELERVTGKRAEELREWDNLTAIRMEWALRTLNAEVKV
jgi:hypothetical protein